MTSLFCSVACTALSACFLLIPNNGVLHCVLQMVGRRKNLQEGGQALACCCGGGINASLINMKNFFIDVFSLLIMHHNLFLRLPNIPSSAYSS